MNTNSRGTRTGPFALSAWCTRHASRRPYSPGLIPSARPRTGPSSPVGREQPPGRELRPRAWHADQVAPGEHGAIERDVLGLAPVVELLADARADLLGDLGGVDRGLHAAVDGEDPVELTEIGLD